MDPYGFGLENFDAIGRWRATEGDGKPIDAADTLPDGTAFNGPSELRAAILRRPDEFVKTFTRKLLTYALGRGLESYDEPPVPDEAQTGGARGRPGGKDHRGELSARRSTTRG
jgi:hypothetical protein